MLALQELNLELATWLPNINTPPARVLNADLHINISKVAFLRHQKTPKVQLFPLLNVFVLELTKGMLIGAG